MDRKRLSKPELLAPAGDLNRAKTAIDYGADAVYLGGQLFSLRSRASNFSVAEIAEACAYAKAHGANIHVTVNIIPHEEDFEGLVEYLKKLEEVGVTAIIVASPTIMGLAKKYAPGLEVHCSTQMSLTNSGTANFLVDTLHIDRVVLARECSLEEVEAIVNKCPVDTEAFIHGGMCVNYSGRCTLSNRMTLRDANRGGCAQSCRWSYQLYQDDAMVDENTYFTMGSKDMCAARELADLMRIGVRSLKIEGRMKTEYYVASIVSGYRHFIDELYEADGELSEERIAYHLREIARGENRETCPGFYRGVENAGIITHETNNSDVNHDFLGKVVSVEGNSFILETRNPIDCKDNIEVMEPGTGNRTFIVESIVNAKGEEVESCHQPMSRIRLSAPFAVKEGDIVRKAI